MSKLLGLVVIAAWLAVIAFFGVCACIAPVGLNGVALLLAFIALIGPFVWAQKQ